MTPYLTHFVIVRVHYPVVTVLATASRQEGAAAALTAARNRVFLEKTSAGNCDARQPCAPGSGGVSGLILVFRETVYLEHFALKHKKGKHRDRQAEGFEIDPGVRALAAPDHLVCHGE